MPKPLDFDGLQQMLWTFAQHRVLTAAARSGMLEKLSERVISTEDLAAELDLDAASCGKVVRALTALGMAERRDEKFTIAPSLAELFKPGPENLTPFFDHSFRMYESWGAHLETWLEGGVWPRSSRTPDEVRAFGRAMRAIGTQSAKRCAEVIDLEGVSALLDVGGGRGHWSQTLCGIAPGMAATVFDIPETARAGEEGIRGGPFEGRIAFRGGDYLEDDLGGGFDLVLIANVLHQESEDRAERLVARCAGALAPGGRLVIVDFRIDDDRCGPPLGALFAINMRDFGDTWTEGDYRRWAERAGLKWHSRSDVGPDRWVLVARKPTAAEAGHPDGEAPRV